MNGEMVVADLADVEAMLAARQPTIVKEWTMADFPEVKTSKDEMALTRGMTAFVRHAAIECHVVAGRGVNLDQILAEWSKSSKRAQVAAASARSLERDGWKFRRRWY